MVSYWAEAQARGPFSLAETSALVDSAREDPSNGALRHHLAMWWQVRTLAAITLPVSSRVDTVRTHLPSKKYHVFVLKYKHRERVFDKGI